MSNSAARIAEVRLSSLPADAQQLTALQIRSALNSTGKSVSAYSAKCGPSPAQLCC